MKNYFFVAVFSVLISGLIVFACNSVNPSVEPEPVGSLSLAFDNVVGNQNLTLNTGTYQNAAGESF
jgi:hypothetical protein